MRRGFDKEWKYKHLLSPWNWKGKPSKKIKILTSIIWFWFECLHSNLKNLIPSLQYVLGYLSWQQMMLEWRCGNVDTTLFNIVCFLGGVHWFICPDMVSKFNAKETLWPFFIDGVQLPQGYRATTRRQFTFYHSVPRSSWCSIDQPREEERLSWA